MDKSISMEWQASLLMTPKENQDTSDQYEAKNFNSDHHVTYSEVMDFVQNGSLKLLCNI